MPSYKNNAKIYIDENARITEVQDTTLLVSGAENESAINLFIEAIFNPTVVSVSFLRADGLAITNRAMTRVGQTEDGKYIEYVFFFKENDRILDISGGLEVSFKCKSSTKTIATVSNVLKVRRTVQPNNDITLEDTILEEVQDALDEVREPIGTLEANVNQLQNTTQTLETNLENAKTSITTNTSAINELKNKQTINESNINANSSAINELKNNQTTLEGRVNTNTSKISSLESQTQNNTDNIATKVSKINTPNRVYGTDNSGNQTSIEIGTGGNKIVKTTSTGHIETITPTNNNHATDKAYVDNKTAEAKQYASDLVDGIEIPDNTTDIENLQSQISTNTNQISIWKGQIQNNSSHIAQKLDSAFFNFIKATNLEGNELLAIYSAGTKKISVSDLSAKIKSDMLEDRYNAFVYDTTEEFLEKVTTNFSSGKLSLVSITNEDNSITWTANEVPIGFTILIRDNEDPDYWLSRKEVETSINDKLLLFEENNYNIDLSNYVTDDSLNDKLLEYVKSTELLFTNSLPTTIAVGGIPKGTTFPHQTIREVLDMLLYPYVEFSISYSTSPNGGTYEKGTTAQVASGTVSIKEGSKPITKIEYLNPIGQIIATQTSGITSSNKMTLNTTISSNGKFGVRVTDGETTLITYANPFTFVDPYYYGAVNSNTTITEALIKSLTKDISKKGTNKYKISMVKQKALIAYPSSYGDLTQIYDENGLKTIEAFVKSTLSINGVSYNVYILHEPVTSTMEYTITY